MPYTVAEYDEIVQLVNAGSSLSAARETKGISRSHFTRKRCISEASKVDADGLRRSILQLRKVTLPNLYTVAKEICNRNLDRLRSLHAEGAVLPPKEHWTGFDMKLLYSVIYGIEILISDCCIQ